MNRKPNHILFFAFALWPSLSFSKSAKVDSLKKVLLTAKEDTNRVNALNMLGYEVMFTKTDTSILLGNEALLLSESLKWKKGMATSLGNLGIYYWLKADYVKAHDCSTRALK